MKTAFILLTLITNSAFGYSNPELEKALCSKSRVQKYKEIIKVHYEKIEKCLSSSTYDVCKEKFNITFPFYKSNVTSCYSFLPKRKKEADLCYDHFKKGNLKAAEKMIFDLLARPSFTSEKIFSNQIMNCKVTFGNLNKRLINGVEYQRKRDYQTKKYKGNLTLGIHTYYEAPDGWEFYTPSLFFFHKDKTPGKPTDFEGVTPDDVDNITIVFRGLE